MLVGVSLKKVVREPIGSRYFVLLQSLAEEKYLKINVGKSECESIECGLHDIEPPRPMTHDMVMSLFSSSDKIQLKSVVIDKCHGGVFHAKMSVIIAGEEVVIDCRPSDAIALGIRLDAPILVDGLIMEEHSIVISD